jgi:hypothetical protein
MFTDYQPGFTMLRTEIIYRIVLPLLAAASIFLVFIPRAEAQVRTVGLKAGGGNSSMIFFYGRCPTEAAKMCVEFGQPHEPRRGFAGGAFVQFGLSRVLSLQPELLFVQKGFEVTGPTLHLSYVEMPVLLQVHPRGASARGIRPFVHGGLVPALLTSCTAFGTHVEGAYHGRCGEVEPADVQLEPRSYDLGLALGGGLNVMGLVVELRHTRGLIDNQVRPHPERSTNRALTALVGYSVPLLR